MKKITYKVRNWSEYNKSLEQRGSLSVWIPEELIENWFDSESRAGRGTSQIYSNSAIEFCLILRHLYHQPLRQTRGFVASLFQLMDVDLPVPCYSTVCRRAQQLELCIRSEKTLKEPLNIAFDGTGLKVFGEGEWKVRVHGADKRRTWVKLHLTIDTETQEMIAAVVTGSDTFDSEVLGDMLEQIPERIQDGFGDGAYDSKDAMNYCLNDRLWRPFHRAIMRSFILIQSIPRNEISMWLKSRPLVKKSGNRSIDTTSEVKVKPLFPDLNGSSENVFPAVYAILRPLISLFDASCSTVSLNWGNPYLLLWLINLNGRLSDYD